MSMSQNVLPKILIFSYASTFLSYKHSNNMKGYPSLIDVLWLIFSIFSGSVYHSFLSCGITPSVNHALQNFSQIPVKLMSLYLVSSTYFPSQSFRDSPILDPFLKKKNPVDFKNFICKFSLYPERSFNHVKKSELMQSNEVPSNRL